MVGGYGEGREEKALYIRFTAFPLSPAVTSAPFSLSLSLPDINTNPHRFRFAHILPLVSGLVYGVLHCLLDTRSLAKGRSGHQEHHIDRNGTNTAKRFLRLFRFLVSLLERFFSLHRTNCFLQKASLFRWNGKKNLPQTPPADILIHTHTRGPLKAKHSGCGTQSEKEIPQERR